MSTIMIDNYDSFTWNVVQYLAELGADVKVYRNDEISVQQLVALQPRNIVISPGPGHPRDAGISLDVIRHFAGQVPILGVCLGEQSIFEVFGGTVTYAGEIVHGKTSPIRHDGKGLYHGVPQDIQVTRYHSLAGDPSTLPDTLEVTSQTANGIIMGVRHKLYTVEGVQYHPESVISEYGKQLLANFLRLQGGRWEENPEFTVPQSSPRLVIAHAPKSSMTILEKIFAQRQRDVAACKATPGSSESDLLQYLRYGLAPTPINLYTRLQKTAPQTAVMAEFKRASPSKGDINVTANPVEQALAYADAGASTISVLTEPTWFKGSLQDMRLVRSALEGRRDRPAVLRKDFIFDKYQILEARLAGADSILLIVACLDPQQLVDLMSFSRSLEMEPLVEVNNAAELEIAVTAGSKVIGVNNRNLHTFSVDMSTTTAMAALLKEHPEIILAALSGITSRDDVRMYEEAGVRAVLVGEALMRSTDRTSFIHELLGITPTRKDHLNRLQQQ